MINNPNFDFKCPGCDNPFGLFDGCGTGITWTCLRCKNCHKFTAVGWTCGFIPKEVKTDFKIQL